MIGKSYKMQYPLALDFSNILDIEKKIIMAIFCTVYIWSYFFSSSKYFLWNYLRDLYVVFSFKTVLANI